MQFSREGEEEEDCIHYIYNKIWDYLTGLLKTVGHFNNKKMDLQWHFIQYKQIGTIILKTCTTIETRALITL